MAYYRIHVPATALQRLRYARYVDPPRPISAGAYRPRGDVVILSRNSDRWRLDHFAAMQDRGQLIVADEDDNRRSGTESHLMGSASLDEHWEDIIRQMYDLRHVKARSLSKGHSLDLFTKAGLLDEDDRTWAEVVLSGEGGYLPMQRDVMRAIVTCATVEEALIAAAPYHEGRVQEETFRRCDLVTVSTGPLAEVIRPLNPHVVVLPNCLDLRLPAYQPRSRRKPHEGVIIGWAGGRDHLPDLALVYAALDELLAFYDGSRGRPWLRLMLAGDVAEAFTDRRWAMPNQAGFAQTIATTSRSTRLQTVTSSCGRYLYRPGMPGAYRFVSVYEDVDIGIVPNRLGHAVYDAKSDVKGLEMAGMAVPCVASPIPAYVEWRGEPGTGAAVLPDNRPESWLAAVRLLIEDEGVRHRMAEEALAFAQSRSIDRWAPEWWRAYEEALSRQAAARKRRRRTAAAAPPPLRPVDEAERLLLAGYRDQRELAVRLERLKAIRSRLRLRAAFHPEYQETGRRLERVEVLLAETDSRLSDCSDRIRGQRETLAEGAGCG